MNLPRTPIPSVLTVQPLLAGIESEIFFPVAGLFSILLFTAQTSIYNILVALLIGPPVFMLLRSRTQDDPFFFRVFRQGFSMPKYLPATSGLHAPVDRVLTGEKS